MTVKTIVLRGAGIRKEAIAAGVITPGELVEITSSGTIQRQSSAAAQTQRAFAVENEVIGDDIDTDYAALDTVLYGVYPRGVEIYAYIVEEDITRGDALVAAGDGSLKGTSVVGQVPVSTGIMTDDDSAASNGLVVYVHTDELSQAGGPFAHLESITVNNADAEYDIGVDGPRVMIMDDDAANTAGFQLYFDEDAASTDERFLCNNTVSGKDLFVPLSDGSVLRIVHNASPSGTGVAVYFDDDATNEEDRMLFISPTDAAGSFTTDDDVGFRAYTGPETVIALALETVSNSGGGSKARCKVEII